MARKNITAVIRAFLAGVPAVGDSRRTCWTDGEVLYSYAMPIAWRRDPRLRCFTLVAYECAPTATTRSHVRAVESECPGAIRVQRGAPLPKPIRPLSSGFALAPTPPPTERRKRAAAIVLGSGDQAAE